VAGKRFTLMIVPEAVHGQVRRWQVPRRTLWAIGFAAMAGLSALGAVLVHYSYTVDQVFEARTLRDENAKLRERLNTMTTKVDEVDGKLADLRNYDQRLRALTSLRDDDRGLTMGPLKATGSGSGGSNDLDAFAAPAAGDDPAIADLRDALLDSRLAGLAAEAKRQVGSLSELVDHFSARELLLRNTPSIAPARGLLTSGFGAREDPFTGSFTMHAGLDIAAREGADVISPADGVVVFSGEKSEYGNCVIIDHGRDLKTLYGHMQRALVKAGETVTRGQHIGNVGNTGRSTGPHLHYEVRRDDVPVNPRPYIVH
jgi:murein DD-endopeptidase MepM/ murein hydrolase activator NlpD